MKLKNSYSYWINRWQTSKSFRVENDRIKQKSFLFSSFPKTNIYGFQNGNIRPQLIGDFFSRYQRMDNFNVMYPVGYDSLGLKSFLENKKYSNLINDDISIIFRQQLLNLGVAIDETKEIDLKHNEYLTILQLAFIDLYEKGYIKYDNVVVYQDDNHKKIIDSYYKNDSLHPNRVKSFYLDISNCIDDIIDKINTLNTTDEIKKQLLNILEPNRSINIDLMLTNGKQITINMKNPEFMSGIAFICLHPDYIDLDEFVSLDELSAMEEYLSADNTNDFGFFTGNYAINPLTGNKIPVFISVNYNVPVYIGNPHLNKEDYETAISEGIRILNITQDGVFVQSDFLNGIRVEEGKELLIENFLEADMCTVDTYYEKKEILLSSTDTLGALIPFLKDSDDKIYSLKKHLPFVFSPQFRPILGNDVDVPGRTIEGSINHLFSSGLTPLLSLIYDEIGGSSSIFSKETIDMLKKWDGIEVYSLTKNEIYVGIFMPLVILSIIEKEKEVKLPPLFKKLLLIENTLDTNEEIMERSNNNLFDLDKLLNKFSPDAVRLYFLSKPVESFVFNVSELEEMNNLLLNIEQYFNNNFSLDNSNQNQFESYLKECDELIKNKEVDLYVNKVIEMYNNVLVNIRPTREQALSFLKLLYPIMPFMADDINKEIFKSKYLIGDDGWI